MIILSAPRFAGARIEHTFRKGERLSDVAQLYGVSPRVILMANPTRQTVQYAPGQWTFAGLQEGDRIQIPAARVMEAPMSLGDASTDIIDCEQYMNGVWNKATNKCDCRAGDSWDPSWGCIPVQVPVKSTPIEPRVCKEGEVMTSMGKDLCTAHLCNDPAAVYDPATKKCVVPPAPPAQTFWNKEKVVYFAIASAAIIGGIALFTSSSDSDSSSSEERAENPVKKAKRKKSGKAKGKRK